MDIDNIFGSGALFFWSIIITKYSTSILGVSYSMVYVYFIYLLSLKLLLPDFAIQGVSLLISLRMIEFIVINKMVTPLEFLVLLGVLILSSVSQEVTRIRFFTSAMLFSLMCGVLIIHYPSYLGNVWFYDVLEFFGIGYYLWRYLR